MDAEYLFEALADHQVGGRFVHVDLAAGNEESALELGELAEIVERDQDRRAVARGSAQ